MSNSPLVSFTILSPNKNPRNHAIDTITIHCTDGQMYARSIGEMYKNPGNVSCNYGIGCDALVVLCVEENCRSWCSSNADNDHRAITIEVSSDRGAPQRVSDAVYNKLIDLLVDICQRNNIKKLLWEGNKALIGNISRQNMTVHRWFKNKECPGDYLYNKHGEIAAAVNKRLGTYTSSSPNNSITSTVTSTKVSYIVRVAKDVSLRIRSGPGTNYSTVDIIKPGAYTIVAESNGTGASKWGKLKSGAGWISLDYVTKT